MFMNSSGIMAIILTTATQTTTGSLVVTLSLLLMSLFAIAIMFGIPLEYTAVIFLPLTLAYATYYGDFIALLICFLIYLSFWFTKNWIIK